MSEITVEKPEKVNGAGKYPAKRKPRKPKPIKRRKPTSLKRSRALRRKNVEFQPFAEEHMKYVYAAYKRGIYEELDQDMDAPAFALWLGERISIILQTGNEVVTMFGETPQYGVIPLGLATLEYHGKIAYPHALWFPDASPRNKLEIGLAFFIQLKKQHVAMITSAKENKGYFDHLCKYGVIRKVGRLLDWYADGEHSTLYQSVGH